MSTPSLAQAGDGDRGSASVWVASCAMVLCLVFGLVLVLAEVVEARHRSAAAADLAALAAAGQALQGASEACAVARDIAQEQQARVSRCVVDGEVVDLSASVSAGPYTASARARAGPVGADERSRT